MSTSKRWQRLSDIHQLTVERDVARVRKLQREFNQLKMTLKQLSDYRAQYGDQLPSQGSAREIMNYQAMQKTLDSAIGDHSRLIHTRQLELDRHRQALDRKEQQGRLLNEKLSMSRQTDELQQERIEQQAYLTFMNAKVGPTN